VDVFCDILKEKIYFPFLFVGNTVTGSAYPMTSAPIGKEFYRLCPPTRWGATSLPRGCSEPLERAPSLEIDLSCRNAIAMIVDRVALRESKTEEYHPRRNVCFEEEITETKDTVPGNLSWFRNLMR
jgi:hypothetical protein